MRLLKIKPNAQAEIEFLIQSLSNILLEEEDLLKNGSKANTFVKSYYVPLRRRKAGRVLVRCRTRDSLSHVSQWTDSYQNHGVSQIFLLFKNLMVV